MPLKRSLKSLRDLLAKARLLLTKEWVCNNVPMFAKNNNIKYEIEMAPDILELDYSEKFTARKNQTIQTLYYIYNT